MTRAVWNNTAALQVGEREVELRVQVSRRARRISLRLDPACGGMVLVLPSKRALTEGLGFAASKADWIQAQLDAVAPRIPFADGTVLPLLGTAHRIRHRPDARGGVWASGGEIHVAGAPEHLPRRVADWLRAEARRAIAPRARDRAAELGHTLARISIRDPKTRWASCARGGAMSFSWRLILAPEAVLDYVVAHEAAHLREMNHGPCFWALVDRLCPGHAAPRRWLRRHGADLHRYG